jgi:hypothetical protein
VILPQYFPKRCLLWNYYLARNRGPSSNENQSRKKGVIIKRQNMLYDGNNCDDSEFTKEVAGSLGAFSTTNQWSLEKLVEKLRHKILLVR